MVSTACFPPNAAARRYTAFRTPYLASYADRSRAVDHGEPSCSAIMGDGADDTTTQRKRIAVACGRCRKRKIRCSGDTGNGDPCVNCRNAGSDSCRFLRVLSEELSSKGDVFSYNLDASRLVQARASSVAPTLSLSAYTDGAMSVGENTPMPAAYKGPTGPYNGSSRHHLQASAMGWSGTYPEDSVVDYSLCQPSYPAAPDSSYLATAPCRPGTGSGAPSKQTGGPLLFVDAEGPFGYGAMPTTGMRHRSGVEPAALAYQGMASPSLSRSLSNTGAQRMPGAARGLAGPCGPYPSDGGAAPAPAPSDYRRDATATVAVSGAYHGFEGAQSPYAGQTLAGHMGRAGDVFSDGLLQAGGGASLRTTATATVVSSGPETGFPALSEPAYSGHEQSGGPGQQQQQQQHHGPMQPPQTQHSQHSLPAHHAASTADSGASGMPPATDGSQAPAPYMMDRQQQQQHHHQGGSPHDVKVEKGASAAGDGRRRPWSSAKARS